MSELFLDVLNMGIRGSWILLVALLLRIVLYKGTAHFRMLLWGLCGVALLCPFTVESPLSLIPTAETVSPGIMTAPRPSVDTGFASLDQIVNPVILNTFAPDPVTSMNPLQFWIPLASALWLIGIAVLLGYIVCSYFLLRHRVKDAAHCEGRIYSGESVHTPFVLGILSPKIYLPSQLSEYDREYVLSHEEAHIRRCDHWWKLIGFLVLTLHWFNPLVWLAYILLCKDIEVACDEAVVKQFSPAQRADYSQALLNCCTSATRIQVCPLAFGEVSIKERVKNVLNYKKPAFWIVIVSVVAIVVTAVCFLTVPVKDVPSNPFGISQQKPHFVYPSYSGYLSNGEYNNGHARLGNGYYAPTPAANEAAKVAIGPLVFNHQYTIIEEIPQSDLSFYYHLSISFDYGPWTEIWAFYEEGIMRTVRKSGGSSVIETVWYRKDPALYAQLDDWYQNMYLETSEAAIDRLVSQ